MQGSSPVNLHKISDECFNLPCYELANYLLGKLLIRKIDGNILKGRIVETECYLGGEDKASHSYNGKKTPRNEAMFMPPGTSYVYMTYGIYYCFNISATEPGAAVLLRALEPLQGLDYMRSLRNRKETRFISGHGNYIFCIFAVKRRDTAKPLKDTELCNGPSKLCMAMNINKMNCNKVNMCASDELYIEKDPCFDDSSITVVKTGRIGIDSAGEEWAKKPLRFYILNNHFVSRRDKKAERDLSV